MFPIGAASSASWFTLRSRQKKPCAIASTNGKSVVFSKQFKIINKIKSLLKLILHKQLEDT